jgi:hypothetical protein
MQKSEVFFYFADEPQFKTLSSRQWTAHYLRACRNVENSNKRRFTVRRVMPGYFTVKLNAVNTPTAVLIVNK